MNPEAVTTELHKWLELAEALREELEAAEPDEHVVQALLMERVRVQERVAMLLEEARSDAVPAQPEWAQLAALVMDEDRGAMELARKLQAQALARLTEVSARRDMAAGYRRALVRPVRDVPGFVDRHI